MTLHRMALWGALGVTPALPARAQQPTGPAGWVQAEGYYHTVSNDFGDWKGLGLQLHAPVGSRTVWDLTGLVQEAFRDQGVWLGAGNRYQFHRDWFSYVAVGGGTGQYHLPDLRTDLTIGKSWLDRRNLVTLVSGTYVKAKRGYSDVARAGQLGGLPAWRGDRGRRPDQLELPERGQLRSRVRGGHGRSGTASGHRAPRQRRRRGLPIDRDRPDRTPVHQLGGFDRLAGVGQPERRGWSVGSSIMTIRSTPAQD